MGDPCTVEAAEHAEVEDWDSAKAAEGHTWDAEDGLVGRILAEVVRRLGEDRSLEVGHMGLEVEEHRRRDLGGEEEDMAFDSQMQRGDGEDGRSG